MDETNPAYENFRNKMATFGQPIKGTTRRISASKFLGRDNIGEQVAINSRKITILKNVIQAQQIQTGVMLASLSESSPVKSMEESIMDIKQTMTSILETLKAQEDFEMKKFLDMQRRNENERRGKRESFLERVNKRGVKLLQKGVDKVIAPVRNIFSRIISSFVTLIGGKFLIGFLNFFLNPKNIGIVNGISSFISNFFPVIIAGVVAATIGIAALAVKVIGITRLLGIAAASLGFGGPAAALFGLNLSRLGGEGVSTKAIASERMSNMKTSGGQFFGKFKTSLKRPRIRFNMGGLVPGFGNTDTVPAMLTPGEVVISKPAVQKFGLGNLLALNKSAGSTNKPTIRNGVSYANEGMVTPNIGDLFNSLINTANQLPESPLGKKMIGFETPMKEFAERVGSQVSTDDVKGLAGSLQTNVPRILGSKMNIPKITSAVRDLPNLLPINVNNEGGGSIFDDLSGIMNKFNNPDLSDASAENDLFDVELTSPSLEKLHTLGMFA